MGAGDGLGVTGADLFSAGVGFVDINDGFAVAVETFVDEGGGLENEEGDLLTAGDGFVVSGFDGPDISDVCLDPPCFCRFGGSSDCFDSTEDLKGSDLLSCGTVF